MSPEQNKPRIDDALILAKEFGGIALIPADRLAEIGYQRMGEGQIAPLGTEPKNITPELTLEQKYENAPFETLTLSTPRAEIARASVLYTYNGILERCIKLDSHLDNWPFKLPQATSFVDNFTNWVSAHAANLPTEEKLILDAASARADASISSDVFSASHFVTGKNLQDIVEDSFFESRIDPDRENLCTEDMQKLWTQLDKLRATALDKDQTHDPFEWLYDPHDLDAGSDIDIDHFEQQFPNMYDLVYTLDEPQNAMKHIATRFKTPFSVLTYGIAQFTAHKGLTHAAEAIKNAPDSTTATASIKAELVQSQDLHERYQDIANLKKRMGSATIEEKRQLSHELASKKQEAKGLKKLLLGIADFFDTQHLVKEIVASEIKALQKDLFIIRSDSSSNMVFELDGKYDAEKDADPGALTGDCTASRPLPFDRPEIPLFNIKIYDEASHVGNAYLLVTQTSDGKPAWHFEAIQLPSGKVDWSKFPESFVSAVSDSTKSQGVQRITINTTWEKISNFDYVGNAFLDYVAQKQGSAHATENAVVTYPKNPDRNTYSDFQGYGPALVLWEDTES